MRDVLILIDIQNEYISEGRSFYLKGIESSLMKCREMLGFARKNGWDILHVQHSNEGRQGIDRFQPGTTYFNFIDGFEPKNGEKHFIKKDFSCYSSDEFSAYLDNLYSLEPDVEIYIAGYSSTMCCLSTLEEARRRNHKFNFLCDASLAKALEGFDEDETHSILMRLYKAKGLAKFYLVSALINEK